MKSVLVTDLGGTKSRVAVLGEDRRVLASIERPTRGSRTDYVAALTADLLDLRDRRHPGYEPPCAVGIATAGVIEPDRRTLLMSPNMPFGKSYPLADTLESALGLPVRVINDGRASAIGEHRFGAAPNADPMIALFFGTGIGIGVILDGQPLEGANNAAGEIGHTLHLPRGRRCGCGRLGCHEAYCGGRAITERAVAEIAAAATSPREWRVDDVVAAADRGDAAAQAILDDARTSAGALVAGLCTVFNPAVVVLGGGVLSGWPQLALEIEAFTRSWCASTVTSDLRFVPTVGGSDAILWGAAVFAAPQVF